MMSDVEASIEVRNACLQIHPRLMSLIPNSESEPGLNVVSYSNKIEIESKVESKVDAIYKQMYDEHITIDQVIQIGERVVSSNIRSQGAIRPSAERKVVDKFVQTCAARGCRI